MEEEQDQEAEARTPGATQHATGRIRNAARTAARSIYDRFVGAQARHGLLMDLLARHSHIETEAESSREAVERRGYGSVCRASVRVCVRAVSP